MVYPERVNWSNNNAGLPITILNSGTHNNISTNDWPDAMQWLKENTSEDAVIAAWWDYGYWISTLGERKTLADNATVLDWQIRKIAATYMSTPEDAWHILTSDTETDASSYYVTLPTDVTSPTRHTDYIYDENQNKLDQFKAWKDCIVDNIDCSGWVYTPEKIYDPEIAEKYPTLFDYWESEVYVLSPVITGLDADYIIINLAVEKLGEDNIMDLYLLNQRGGDETKAFWFFKIAGLSVFDYYGPELTSYTDKFWDDTLFAKLIPFTPILYVDSDNPEIQSETFKPGYTAIYVKDIKFPADGDGPFQLVYVSPSFQIDAAGPLTGPLIYKINKEYNPNQ
jgi:dolichyl-diphosphooligosaccharide--protein glycosyltransferase